MKQRSLFRKYFSACVGMILLTIVVLGVVFLGFASRYFREDRFALLEKNADYAQKATESLCFHVDGSYKISPSLDGVYQSIGNAIDADVYLVNIYGHTLLCTCEESDCIHKQHTIPGGIIDLISQDGSYMDMSDQGGIYDSNTYTVGLPLIVEDKQMAGIIFISSDAEGLLEFRQEMLEIFLLSAICVLVIAFAVIYLITSNMVRPLRSMVSATESFVFAFKMQVANFLQFKTVLEY